MTDLPQLDLAYAPPYSGAKDPIIVNGLVTSNSVNGHYEEISVKVLQDRLEGLSEIQFIDVRSEKEVDNLGMINGAINMPLDTLRDNLERLDKEKETIVYCATGMRDYLASRILGHHGFKEVKNLAGGYTVWSMYHLKKDKLNLELV